jgi:hypothetical protein
LTVMSYWGHLGVVVESFSGLAAQPARINITLQ